jgi:uncharacterized protein YdeI (YjbR/CyaY-like superfamily)
MAKKEPRIDAYILKAGNFAKPVLKHFRELVHKTCPDVQEKIKWGFPHFDYMDAPMCSIASFKQHCSIGFWKAALFDDAKTLVDKAKSEEAMGHLGRITGLNDLPKDSVLVKYIKNGMRLNEEGVKLPPRKKTQPAEIKVPPYFLKALSKNKKAQQNFDAFSPGNKKEYIMWITEAKTEETRERRLETAVEWISEGKSRNWKYQK